MRILDFIQDSGLVIGWATVITGALLIIFIVGYPYIPRKRIKFLLGSLIMFISFGQLLFFNVCYESADSSHLKNQPDVSDIKNTKSIKVKNDSLILLSKMFNKSKGIIDSLSASIDQLQAKNIGLQSDKKALKRENSQLTRQLSEVEEKVKKQIKENSEFEITLITKKKLESDILLVKEALELEGFRVGTPKFFEVSQNQCSFYKPEKSTVILIKTIIEKIYKELRIELVAKEETVHSKNVMIRIATIP